MIPKIGFMASALATLVTYGFMMLVSYFIGKKHYPVPYQIKKVMLYLIGSSVLSGLSFLVFRENYWFSALAIVAFLGWVYWQEHKVLKKIFYK